VALPTVVVDTLWLLPDGVGLAESPPLVVVVFVTVEFESAMVVVLLLFPGVAVVVMKVAGAVEVFPAPLVCGSVVATVTVALPWDALDVVMVALGSSSPCGVVGWDGSVVVVALSRVTVWSWWACVVKPVPVLSSVVFEFVDNVVLEDSVDFELDDEVLPEEPVGVGVFVVVVVFVVVFTVMEFGEVVMEDDDDVVVFTVMEFGEVVMEDDDDVGGVTVMEFGEVVMEDDDVGVVTVMEFEEVVSGGGGVDVMGSFGVAVVLGLAEVVSGGGGVDVMGSFGVAVVLGLAEVMEGVVDVDVFEFVEVPVEAASALVVDTSAVVEKCAGGLVVEESVFAAVVVGVVVAVVTAGDVMVDCAMATIFIPTRG